MTALMNQEVKDYLDLYLRWRKGVDWLKIQVERNPIDVADLQKLERRVDYLWTLLSEEERNEVFEDLVKNGYFPERFKEVLNFFGETLTSIKKQT